MIRGISTPALTLSAIAGDGASAAPYASARSLRANSKSAANDGRNIIPKRQLSYSPKLDRDGDGIGRKS